MAQIPNLDNSPLSLNSIREQCQRELLNIISSIRGKKCLVVDPKLSGSLSQLIQTSTLKDHGGSEIYHLSAEPVQTGCNKVVYLVRSKFSSMNFICTHIHNDLSRGLQKEYYIFFVPRSTVVCEKILEDENVHHLVTVGEYPLYFVPLDEDVLSFECDFSSKECHADGDPGSLWHIAKAIHKLELSFGVIPAVRTKGDASNFVADMLNRLNLEEPVSTSNIAAPEIDMLVLLDREVDYITPMCSQLTYEGLIDEFLHINNSSIDIDASVVGVKEGKKVKVLLNSSDKLFKEIRDLNFEFVVQVLRQKATAMKQDYTEINTSQSVSELKDFVKKLNTLPEMTRHIHIAQHVSDFTSKHSFLSRLDMEQTLIEAENYEICFDYIEELIHKQEPLVGVLRLLVLFSITNNGLPKKQFDYMRRELLHSYGYEHIGLLNNLEKAGMFKKQESKGSWLSTKRTFNLLVDTSTANPTDISYVFSGYAPLSVRLVQHALHTGWSPMDEALKLLPGPHSKLKRGGLTSAVSSGTQQRTLEAVDRQAHGRRSLVLVVFIGGVTFAEISALRFLASQEGMAHDIIIGTTKIINGNTLIESLMN